MIQKSFNDGEGNSALPTEFKDPFVADAITSVDYSFNKRKSFMRDDCFHQAKVYFNNGNSKGDQSFYDDDPDTLRKRVDNFINSLK